MRTLPELRPDIEKSVGQLFSELSADLSLLMRKEVELARVEIKEQVRRSAKTGGMFGGAGFAGYMAVILFSFAGAWAFAVAIPIWAGFLIMGFLYAVVGAALFFNGRKQARAIHPVPEHTVETLKEDMQWAKTQLK